MPTMSLNDRNIIESLQDLSDRCNKLSLQLYEYSEERCLDSTDVHQLAEKVNQCPATINKLASFMPTGPEVHIGSSLTLDFYNDVDDIARNGRSLLAQIEIATKTTEDVHHYQFAVSKTQFLDPVEQAEFSYWACLVKSFTATLAIMAVCGQPNHVATIEQFSKGTRLVKAYRKQIESLIIKQRSTVLQTIALRQDLEKTITATPGNTVSLSDRKKAPAFHHYITTFLDRLIPQSDLRINSLQTAVSDPPASQLDQLLLRWIFNYDNFDNTSMVSPSSTATTLSSGFMLPDEVPRRTSQYATVESDEETDIDVTRSRSVMPKYRTISGHHSLLEPITASPSPMSSPRPLTSMPIPIPMRDRHHSIAGYPPLPPPPPRLYHSSTLPSAPRTSGSMPTSRVPMSLPGPPPGPPPNLTPKLSPTTPLFVVTQSLSEQQQRRSPRLSSSPLTYGQTAPIHSVSQSSFQTAQYSPPPPQLPVHTRSQGSTHSSTTSNHDSSKPIIRWRRRLLNSTWDFENEQFVHNNTSLPPGAGLYDPRTVTEIQQRYIHTQALQEHHLSWSLTRRTVSDPQAEHTQQRQFYVLPGALDWDAVYALVQRSKHLHLHAQQMLHTSQYGSSTSSSSNVRPSLERQHSADPTYRSAPSWSVATTTTGTTADRDTNQSTSFLSPPTHHQARKDRRASTPAQPVGILKRREGDNPNAMPRFSSSSYPDRHNDLRRYSSSYRRRSPSSYPPASDEETQSRRQQQQRQSPHRSGSRRDRRGSDRERDKERERDRDRDRDREEGRHRQRQRAYSDSTSDMKTPPPYSSSSTTSRSSRLRERDSDASNRDGRRERTRIGLLASGAGLLGLAAEALF